MTRFRNWGFNGVIMGTPPVNQLTIAWPGGAGAQLSEARGADKKAAMILLQTPQRSGRAPSCMRRVAIAAAAALALAACSSSSDEAEAVSNQSVAPTPSVASSSGDAQASPANDFMWQAALETIGFMPITQLDDLAGVIETGWYIPPGAPTERFRADVAFTSRALRAESMSLKVERQELDNAGNWLNAQVSPAVERNLVDSILSRALVLRQESGSL